MKMNKTYQVKNYKKTPEIYLKSDIIFPKRQRNGKIRYFTVNS